MTKAFGGRDTILTPAPKCLSSLLLFKTAELPL